MAKNNYGLAVSLTESDALTIAEHSPGAASIDQKLAAVAAGLLRDLAKGGTMLAPEWAERVQSAIGTTDPVAIVEAVEKSAGREGECISVPWVIDPSQIAFYEMQAENSGKTLAQQLKAHMDLAYSSGWLGQSSPEAFNLLLTPEQYRRLQAMFEKDVVTGEDVMDRLADQASDTFYSATEDLVLDSLKG